MEKEYKGGRQKMNESREYYKSLLNEQQGPTCYACSNGQVVSNNSWADPIFLQTGYWPTDGIPAVNYMQEFCVVQGHGYMDNGMNTNPMQGTSYTPYNAVVDTATPNGVMSLNEYWFTDQAQVQLMCTSGGTTTATCPSQYSQYQLQTQLNFCSLWDTLSGQNNVPPTYSNTGAELFNACGCSATGTTTQACFGCVNGSIVDSSTNGLYYTPDPQGYCSTFMGNDYYSSPANINLASCGTGSGSGTTSATCMNIKTVQCNDPGSGGEWPCATIDGVVPDQSFVGRVIDAGSSVAATGAPIYYEITEITSSGSSPWGTQDFPEVQGGCPSGINPNSTCDFSWTSSCAQQNLNTGGQNSWDNFLTLRETGFNGAGCQHLQNVVNWNTNQLNSGVNSSGVQLNNVQISRKTEQIAWAQCQANECGCPSLNVPPLTGGPTPPPPSAPPSTGGPKVSTTDKKKKEKKDEMPEKEKKKMNEELNRMKKMWKYQI